MYQLYKTFVTHVVAQDISLDKMYFIFNVSNDKLLYVR